MTPRSEIALLASVTGGAYLVKELLDPNGILRRWFRDWHDPWVAVGTISELHLSPVKSMRAHLVKSAHCSAWGLQVGEMVDRHMIVIESDTGKNSSTGLSLSLSLSLSLFHKEQKTYFCSASH